MKTITANRGYVRYSESVGSHNAKMNGRFPKTLFKKEWGISEKKFLELKERGIIYVSEWHHTSKYANSTDFYAIENLPLFLMVIGRREEAFEAYKKEKYPFNDTSTFQKEHPGYTYTLVLKKEDENIPTLIQLGMRYCMTKRENFRFMLDNEFLKYKIVRDIFKLSI